jgi:hypothetical protein
MACEESLLGYNVASMRAAHVFSLYTKVIFEIHGVGRAIVTLWNVCLRAESIVLSVTLIILKLDYDS